MTGLASAPHDRVGAADDVVTRFAAHAARRPGAIAVACGSSVLSYRDLDKRSSRLARRLRQSAGLEDRVAVCLPPGTDLAVAILGVLKAGAAYVPLDPLRPAGQLHQAVAAAGGGCVITSPGPGLEWDIPRVHVPGQAAAPIPGPVPTAGARNALCVTPVAAPGEDLRLVVTEHGPLARLLRWGERERQAARSVWLLPAPAGGGMEMLAAWWSGGCAVLGSEQDGALAAVTGLLREHVTDTVAGAARLLAALAAAEPAVLSAVPHVIAVDVPARQDDLAGLLADRAVIRSWSQAEAPGATAEHSGGAGPGHGQRIGSPAAGGRAYVLDSELRPVPPGVPGDLYLGGALLARGYASRPGLTAACFLPDPFAAAPGCRMFRTRYRASLGPDGTLELTGAQDGTSRPGGDGTPEPRDRLDQPAAKGRPALLAQPAGEPLPVSFAQERAWLLDQLHPGGTGYLVPARWRLAGRLDAAALERAFRAVLRRHSILRAQLCETGTGLTTVIHPADSVPFEYHDLSGADDPGQAAAAELARPGPAVAGTGPLTRILLLRLGPAEHVLQVQVHEAVSDGDCGPLLAAELSAAYAGCTGGHQPRLPELPLQYTDYAAWQRQACASEYGARLAGYWRRALADAPPVLELPTDHARPPVLSRRGRTVSFTVPGELTAALAGLARAHDSTLPVIALAAYQLLLSRYGGTPDVVVGMPADPRRMPGLQRLIGPLADALPVRTRIDGEASAGGLLGQVRRATREAVAHQDFPFSALAAELALDHDLSHHPVFQVWFQLRRLDPAARQPVLPGLRVTDFGAPQPPAARYDLALHLTEEGTALSGTLTGPADLFEEPWLRRFARNYLSTLSVIAGGPTARLRELELVAPEERDLVLHRWNDAGSSPLPRRTVVEQFASHVRSTPQAPALTCGDVTLTYQELDQRARAVALGLRAGGTGPGSLVGVCLAREPGLPVALLGVAMAGAGYVGLDPADPPDRLATVLRRSGAGLVITAGPAGTANWPVPAATIDGLASAAGDPGIRAAGDAGLGTATAGDVLYVLYTSGSTGQPKGVVMSHGPTARLMHWAQRRYRPRPVALAYFPPTSDVFSYELWSTWWTGGCVVLATEADRFDPASLAKRIAGHQVTTILLPGAILEALAAAHLEQLRSVTEAITTGDRLHITESIRRLAGLGVRLDNQWGSTEVNVVTAARLDPADSHWPDTPPIGSPVAGGRVYVLDDHLRPAPIGVPGDLYVGGTQPGYGYLGQPDLTAAAFLPDPYGAAGTRMYSTGDRGRWLGDGTLQFLGRADQQAKVHGYRVEPGEIEAVITGHPGVAGAAVTVVRTAGTGARLAAYLQAAPGAEPDTPALRDAIGRQLPGYMMPAAFIWLDALPRTATGKIDRRALPVPDFSAAERTPPRDGTDRATIRIWQDILGRPDIGITDNFFDLGGYSMLIPQVVYWLNQEFGVDLPLQALFRAQTVRELADEINARLRADGKEGDDASTAR